MDADTCVQVLNEGLEGLPFVIVKTHVREINLEIPWRTILRDPCKVKINGLEVVIAPFNTARAEGQLLRF